MSSPRSDLSSVLSSPPRDLDVGDSKPQTDVSEWSQSQPKEASPQDELSSEEMAPQHELGDEKQRDQPDDIDVVPVDEADLAQKRYLNDQNLKAHFERIFEKYEHDFTDVGDEIDIETGEIVVNNGHLYNMRYEADPGKSASRQFVKAFADNLEHEDEHEDEDTEVVEGSDDDENSSYAESDAGQGMSGVTSNTSANGQAGEADVSPSGASEMLLDPLLAQLSAAAMRGQPVSGPSLVDGAASRSVDVDEMPGDDGEVTQGDDVRCAAPFDVFGMPAVQDSLAALKSNTMRGRAIEPDAIQALGVSIATQIAQFMGSGGRPVSRNRREKKRKDRTWDFPELPVDKQRKTAPQPSERHVTQQISAVSPTEPQKSFWGPGGRSHVYKRKRDASPETASQALPSVAPQVGPLLAPDGRATPYHVQSEQRDDRDSSPERLPRPQLKSARRAELASAQNNGGTADQSQDRPQGTVQDPRSLKKCYNCEICVTTTWRKGPGGSLCNACGIYHHQHGSVKPLRATTLELVAVHGSKSSRFTVEEDALLIKLKEFDRLSWEKIGRYFEGRSTFAVQCRYAKKLTGQPSEGRDALIEQGFSFDRARNETRDGCFTEQDDELLVQLREESELDWASIANQLPGQTTESIESRYNILLGIYPEDEDFDPQPKTKRQPKPLDPEMPERSTRRFAKEEDELIVKLREADKLSWQDVALQIPGRSGLAVQKRYVRELERRKGIVAKGGEDPYAHLFKDEALLDFDVGAAGDDRLRLEEKFRAHSSLTMAEETLLMRLRDDERYHWEDISDRIPGRSVFFLRNRYRLIREKKESERASGTALRGSVYTIPVSDALDHEGEGQAPTVLSIYKAARYSRKESRLIRKLKDEGWKWGQIALHLPGRTAASLEQRWEKKLKNEHLLQLQESQAATGYAMADDPVGMEEDETLDAIDPSLDQAGPPLSHMEGSAQGQQEEATIANGNEDEQESPVAADTAGTPAPYHVTPILQVAKHRSRYSTQEHDIVVNLRAHGSGWEEVAAHLPGRSMKSVSGHWLAHVRSKNDPRSSLPASGNTEEAEETLLRQLLHDGAGRRSKGVEAIAGLPPHSMPPCFVAPTATMHVRFGAEPSAGEGPLAMSGTVPDGVKISPLWMTTASSGPVGDETREISDNESELSDVPEHLTSPTSLMFYDMPPFSWNELITMALHSSSVQQMTVDDIHDYLRGMFPYFTVYSDGQEETLRQQLSLGGHFTGSGSGLTAVWGFAEKTPTDAETKSEPVLSSENIEVVPSIDTAVSAAPASKSLADEKPITFVVYRDPESSPPQLEPISQHQVQYQDDNKREGLGNASDKENESTVQTPQPGMFSNLAQDRRPPVATLYRRSATPKATASMSVTHIKRDVQAVNQPITRTSLLQASRSRSNSAAGSPWRVVQTGVDTVVSLDDKVA
ncbi:hypothetical protein LTR08_008018 [Meristemomyces frigidus]|nr:hypothetical protein LTR08_008018 [Meristemomyces frigidus]